MRDYVDVAERIRTFYDKFPEGAIQTEMVRLEGDLAVFKATVFRDREDRCPTTGWAYEREGQGFVNKTSFIENCETSAIGRALANLGFPSSRAVAQAVKAKPATAEQIEKIRRLAEADSVSEEIRERVYARLDGKMSAAQADDALAYLEKLQRRGEKKAA